MTLERSLILEREMKSEPDITNEGLTFDEVQSLRDLEDTTLSLTGNCRSAIDVMEKLQTIPDTGFQVTGTLKPTLARLSDLTNSLGALTARINNTIDLVGFRLS